MGTNFYWIENECPHCERHDESDKRHIGKSSAGWCFSLHVYPEDGINTLDDWKEIWKRPGRIMDEYGESIALVDMIARITDRAWGGDKWGPLALAENHAVEGPNGLARHTYNCVGHEGTCDYITGEFS